jgi:aminopeptidase N
MARARDELAFLMAHDSDAFNRWDAGQELAKRLLVELARAHAAGGKLELDPVVAEAFGRVLVDESLDGSYRALALTLPDENVIAQELEVVEPESIHAARRFVVRALARAHRQRWMETYRDNAVRAERADGAAAIDARRLKNRALLFLASLEEPETTALAFQQFERARNMTDTEAALAALVGVDGRERTLALDSFHRRWKHDPLVLDRWFRLQALAPQAGTFEQVVVLAGHADFTLRNPNRVRSLLGAFSQGNPARFHDRSGRPYEFFAEQVLRIDELNPQLAARLVSAFNQWRRFEPIRRAAMLRTLEGIERKPGLSRDTAEIVARALGRA